MANKKWNHAIIRNPTDAGLRSMGEAGWELVAVTVSGWWRPVTTFYFKTPILY
jgi:hypothetical protein